MSAAKEGGLGQIEALLATLLATENAWALLEGSAAETPDWQQAVRLGGTSAQVLTRAAMLLAASDPARSHTLLEQAVGIEGAPAPTQLALSRSFRAQGNKHEASRWLQGAMLRARPDAGLLLEWAAIEIDKAAIIVDAAQKFACRDVRTAQDAALALIASGKRKEGRIACDIAFQAGGRDRDFLLRYSDLLADPGMHADPPLPDGPLGMPHWWNIATHAAQLRLADNYPLAALLPAVRRREESDQWVRQEELAPVLAGRIARAEPFSWIRMGDGEARFLLHLHRALRSGVPEREAEGMARQIWHVWFGQDITLVPQEDLSALGRRLEQAICEADLLGVTSIDRLNNDANHYGFCASLETYLQSLLRYPARTLFTDAGAPVVLNERDPFLSSLLAELDFLGVVSPHADLGERLQRRLGIRQVRHYDIPGEGRLNRAQERTNRGSHFPDTYGRMMAQLEVPRQGAVFLVAGGLLGKIYCSRIRELGGIALDIGAIADAWMGYNTRGSTLQTSMRWQLPV